MTQKKDFIDNLEALPNFLQKNARAIVALAVIAVIGMLGLTFYKNSQAKSDLKKFGSLYEIETKYLEKKEKFEAAKESAKTPGAKPDANAVVASGDMTKDYGDIPEQFEKFIEANKSSTAAVQAALWLSDIYEEYKQPEKAAMALEKSLPANTRGVVTGLAVMRTGNLWAKAEKCDKALDYWQKLANKNYPYFETQALLKIALCNKELGKKEDSRSKLQEIITKYPESTEATSAKKYLRLLDYQKSGASTAIQKNETGKDS